MNDYTEVRIGLAPCSETMTDLLAAMLAECGYESFVPDSDGLTAYVPAADFSEEALRNAIDSCPLGDERPQISVTHTLVEGRDWNAEWEKNYFQPIVIGNRCVIHSSFHTDIPQGLPYDIVIDPKMAFGTGHHQTTTHMVNRLLEMDPQGKQLIDMGTGTGILAILAAMRGAAHVDAIEIDPAAWANAVENTALNGHGEINVVLGDAASLATLPAYGTADVLLANINRNIILADIAAYSGALRKGGVMALSGFYKADAIDIIGAATPLGLRYRAHYTAPGTSAGDGEWTCLVLENA